MTNVSGYFSRSVQRRSRRGDDVDAVGRAGGRAHVAGDALDAALLVAVEPMHAAVVRRQLRLLLRDTAPSPSCLNMWPTVVLRPVDDGRQIERCPEPDLRLGSTHFTSFSAIGMSVLSRSLSQACRVAVIRFGSRRSRSLQSHGTSPPCGAVRHAAAGDRAATVRPARTGSATAASAPSSGQPNCLHAPSRTSRFSDRQRDQHLPGQAHQLVEAEARDRPADEHEEADEAATILPTRMTNLHDAAMPCVGLEPGRVPAAEEQRSPSGSWW